MKLALRTLIITSSVAATAALAVTPAYASGANHYKAACAPSATKVCVTGGSPTVYYGIEAPQLAWTAAGGTGTFTWRVIRTSPAPAVTGLPEGSWSIKSGTGGSAFKIGGTWEPLTGGNPVPGNFKYTVEARSGAHQAVVTVTVLTAPPANAVVGVGAGDSQYAFDQLSNDYNVNRAGNPIYSYDATDPVTGAAGGNIVPETGCNAIPRPNGSDAGISAITNTQSTAIGPCVDWARSDRGRLAGDSGNISFLQVAADAVTWATLPHGGVTYAPGNLSLLQLADIYECNGGATDWNDFNKGAPVGSTIVPILPAGGDIRTFFLQALSGALGQPITLGTCVVNGVDPAGTATPGAPILENEGTNAIFNDVAPFTAANPDPRDELFPFSIGSWLTQRYRDPKCLNTTTCAPATSANRTMNWNKVVCFPTSTTENQYGCDQRGPLILNKVGNSQPTNPSDTTQTNPWFTGNMATSTNGPLMEPEFAALAKVAASQQPPPNSTVAVVFGPAGWLCTNGEAQTDLQRYGFIQSQFAAGLTCGTAS